MNFARSSSASCRVRGDALSVAEVLQSAETSPRACFRRQDPRQAAGLASLRSALPPRGGLLVGGRAESEDIPPAPRCASELPPGVGRSRGFFDVGVLRQGASRSAMSSMRLPDANLDAQILAKKPTKPGGQRRALARKRGACPRALQNRRNEQNANVQEATRPPHSGGQR